MPDDKKKSFIMYNEYINNFELLPREERGDLITLIFRYVNGLDFNLNDYSQSVIMAFSFIKNDLERNFAKYNTTCENRAKAAKKREEARKQHKAQKAQLTTKSTIDHKKHNCDDNENENENVNVNGNENDNELLIMSNISSCSSSIKRAKRVLTPTTDTTTTTTTFTPPTVEQINEFCKQEGLQIDTAQGFIDYNSSRDWQIGRGTMKNWKAAVKRWCASKRNIPAAPKETSYDRSEIETRTAAKYKKLKKGKP